MKRRRRGIALPVQQAGRELVRSEPLEGVSIQAKDSQIQNIHHALLWTENGRLEVIGRRPAFFGLFEYDRQSPLGGECPVVAFRLPRTQIPPPRFDRGVGTGRNKKPSRLQREFPTGEAGILSRPLAMVAGSAAERPEPVVRQI